MPNPMWVAGSKSANPSGRPKSSARSIKGMVERFVRRNITRNRLSRIFDELSASQQADLLMQMLPFIIPKQSPDSISQEEVERLHQMLEQALKEKHSNVV
jgi:RNase P protein component